MARPQAHPFDLRKTSYDPQLGTFDAELANGHLWRYIEVPPELEQPPDGMDMTDHVRLNLAGKFPVYRVK